MRGWFSLASSSTVRQSPLPVARWASSLISGPAGRTRRGPCRAAGGRPWPGSRARAAGGCSAPRRALQLPVACSRELFQEAAQSSRASRRRARRLDPGRAESGRSSATRSRCVACRAARRGERALDDQRVGQRWRRDWPCPARARVGVCSSRARSPRPAPVRAAGGEGRG